MPNTNVAETCHVKFAAKTAEQIIVRLEGRLDIASTARVLKDTLPRINRTGVKTITVDLSEISYFDDYGALVLMQIRKIAESNAAEFQLRNITSQIERILALVNFNDRRSFAPPLAKKRPGIFVRLGEATYQVADNIRFMVAFVGSAILCLGKVLLKPRALRLNDMILQMQKTGVDALPIVALISFLMGFIMAFVSSMQLRQFGASIFVASIVSLAMVSELGPIMTAIIVAGRSGSAYAAEIGTMQISDEVDALFSMGFSPTLFLAVPRILAAVVVMPVLVLFSDLFAILGGLLISVSMLDLSINTYFNQTLDSLTLTEFVWGGSKSIIFAAVIAWVGCLRGFQVRGGAAQVGNAATSAVVSSIFLIILIDSVFAVIRSYW